MKISKWLLGLIALSVLGTGILYPSLPEQIPTHWNIYGQIDKYSGKATAFITALLPLAIYLLMVFFPKIDPRKEAFPKHEKAYTTTSWALAIFLILMHWATLAVALGTRMDIGVIIRVLMGLLFIVLGNCLSQVRPNYFFGIRTPWTLADDTVWRKTHRVGAYGFVIAGIIALLSAFLKGPAGFIMTIGGIIAVSLLTVLYSFLEFRKLKP